MAIKKTLITSALLLFSVFLNMAVASTINISMMSSGSARDDTANGIFDRLSSGIYAQAQLTNYLNIFTVTRGMLEFDISSISTPVSDAKLNLQITGLSGPRTSFDILGYEGNGAVELSDAYLGDEILATVDVDNLGIFSIDVTDYINNSLKNNTLFSGFNLRITSEYRSGLGYQNDISIVTYDSGGVFFPPTLEITHVPLPASIWMLLSGVSILLTCVRRKV